MWASEWGGITSILDLLEGSGSSKYQYDQEEGPEDDSSDINNKFYLLSATVVRIQSQFPLNGCDGSWCE